MSRASLIATVVVGLGAAVAAFPAAQTPRSRRRHPRRTADRRHEHRGPARTSASSSPANGSSAVQDGLQTPAGARVIDLRTSTVLPGFIDAHTHITGEGTGNAIVRAATETPLDDAVRSTVYARRTLEAGFTTIRNVGADGGADVALEARDRGRHRPRPAHLDGADDAQHHRRSWRSGRAAAGSLGRADLDGRHRRQRRRGAQGRAVPAQVRRRSDQDHRDRRRAVDRRLRRRAAVHRRRAARDRRGGASARHEGRRARARQARHRLRDSRRRRFHRARHLRRRRDASRCSSSTARIWCRRFWRARPSPSWRRFPDTSIRPCRRRPRASAR